MEQEAAKRHPVLRDILKAARRGRIDRREFVAAAARLGVSAAAAYAMAGLAPRSAVADDETPKTGGTLRVSMNVKDLDDPARFDWSEEGNVARHFIEPLVRIGRDGVARPWLARGWTASDDLKTWTFRLRRGVKWSNGDDFGADDVIFNFTRWLDPKTGSSNQGRFSSMTTTAETGKKDKDGNSIKSTTMSPGALEKVDEHTVRFHLNRSDISLPESMADYPALIVHRRFEADGGDLAKNPVGTGAFRLAEYRIGERAVLERSDKPYWGGKAFLDRIVYIDHGDDPSAAIAALASGQVDAQMRTSVEQVETLKALPGLKVYSAVTAQTGVARMRLTEKPFDNRKLRQAIQACIDPARMLEVVYRGQGAVGEDHHVSPVHPEYAELPPQKQDYALARKRLAEAGYANGVSLRIDCVANPQWEQNTCKTIAEMVKPAGIDLAINIMPGGTYWDRWLTTPFGFTSWTHRALGVQVLNLAYRSGVAWNETAYANPAFDRLLDEAGTKLDVDERRKVMAKIEPILQDDAIISQDYWRSVFTTAHSKVKGIYAQVALEHHYNKVWIDA